MPESKFAKALWDNVSEACMDEVIRGDERLSSAQRLSIYQSSIRSILINTLKKTFPVCDQLVGSEFFNALASRFIINRPSSSFDLDRYGEEFPDFIADFAPAKSVPYLSDVARLEWYWQEALLAPATETMAPLTFTEINESDDYEDIIFKLPQCIAFLASPYPINKIWEMHQERGSQSVNLDEGAEQLIIGKTNKAFVIVVTPAQWHLLTTLRRGVTFETLFLEFEQHYCADSFAENFAALFQWGLIT